MKISELWVEKIINGDRTYKEVPAQLKKEVSKLLKKEGHSKLAV